MWKPKNKFSVCQSLGVFFCVAFAIGCFSALVHLGAWISPMLADGIGLTVSAFLRGLLGRMSSVFPLSLAELLLIGLPIWIASAVVILKHKLKKQKNTKRLLCGALAFLPILYSLFVFTLGVGYLGTPLSEKLSLKKNEEISAQDLYETALWLAGESESCLSSFSLEENKATVMPFSYRQMNRSLSHAFADLAKTYRFLSTHVAGTKPILLSKPMSYTGITGIYSFFTGEANVNTAQPDYSIVFTAAHEMAHTSGVAREDEANFVAFLACIASTDAYIQYCGYANLLQYVMGALAKTDRVLWKEAYRRMPSTVENDFLAYNAYVEKYDNALIRHAAQRINDTYLKSMGTQGTVSYAMVVDLAVSYHKGRKR